MQKKQVRPVQSEAPNLNDLLTPSSEQTLAGPHCEIPALEGMEKHGNIFIARGEMVVDEKGDRIDNGVLVSRKWAEKLVKDPSFVYRLEVAVERMQAESSFELKEQDFRLEKLSEKGGVSTILKLHLEGKVYAVKARKTNMGNRQATGYHYEMQAMQDLKEKAGKELSDVNASLAEIHFATLRIQCREFYPGREISSLGMNDAETSAFREREHKIGAAIYNAHSMLKSENPALWGQVILDGDEFIARQLRWDAVIETSNNHWVVIDPIATIFLKPD